MGNESTTNPGWQVSELMTLNELVGQEAEGDGSRIGGPLARFHIPIYQRLYVWKKEQIERLLNDILDAWRAGNTSYFIGGILLVERQREDTKAHQLELIDGQQRLTTLLLTALYRHINLHGGDTPYRALLNHTATNADDREPRLHFEIRDRANTWFRKVLEATDTAEALEIGTDEDDASDGGLSALKSGLAIIDEWFKNNTPVSTTGPPDGQHDFDTYLLNSVRMLVTSVPGTMDLNHLFETINDRSVQLEHHEVLKARMLNHLKGDGAKADDGTYAACARVWEACAAMDDYWEEALARAAGKPKTKLFREMEQSWQSGAIGGNTPSPAALNGENAIEFCRPPKANADGSDTRGEESLEAIIISVISSGSGEVEDGSSQTQKKDGVENQRARSLISFPMLLLHTLRIWLHRHGPEGSDLEGFDSSALLDTFEKRLFSDTEFQKSPSEAQKRIKSFIELLWETRYLLDQHVIRWVELKEGGDWGHQLLRLEKASSGNSDTTLRRSESEQVEDKELSLLQSMLYHSQDIRQLLWLTPLLSYLHARTFPATAQARQPRLEMARDVQDHEAPNLTAFMRHLDNGLFSSPSLKPDEHSGVPEGSDTLMERSRSFVEHPWHPFERPNTTPLKGGFSGLEVENLPRTPHYWYYKVDFILWRLHHTHSSSDSEKPPAPLDPQEISSDDLNRAWQDFRFTARTSVEHIYPQNPADPEMKSQDDFNPDVLHSFGNLALVSRERNSEFGNLPYHEKRGKFITRLRQHDLQSPKLAWVYLYGGSPDYKDHEMTEGRAKTWTSSQADNHLNKVKCCLDDYFGEECPEV